MIFLIQMVALFLLCVIITGAGFWLFAESKRPFFGFLGLALFIIGFSGMVIFGIIIKRIRFEL